MEDWVFLGESGSDTESVGFVDGGDDDKDSETSFAMVQLGRSHAKADGGKNQDEEDDDDYFDLNLPALAGSKAVFGANGDCFDLDLAASILSMGSVGGYESWFYGPDAEDDIDTVSLGAADGDSDGTVHPEGVVGAHCANIDTDKSSDAAELVKYDDIDTGSSDSWESDYNDNDEVSDEDNTDGSDAGELNTPSIDPKAALHDYMEDNIAPQQRPWAPHLFFAQRSRSTYESTDAAEDDINNYETVSYSDAATGDNGDDIESSDEDTESCDNGETSYTSLTHRDEVISGFVGALVTRADALARFDAVESALELPQYNLSRSDINAWKAALGKGRAEIAARPRPPVAPHLFFTQPSRST